jgi:acetyl esterase/lipase
MKPLILIVICALAAVLPADQKAVEYGRPGGHALLLDLHVPDGPGPFPAAILVHGGGFDGGSRATNMAPTFQPLADAGFAWFSIDYRMAPEFRFPEARDDIDAAIQWVKANAHTYKVDAAKIVLAGESAGAFLVNYAATHETPATKVAAVVDIYGPVDYEKVARQRQAYPARFNMTSINGHQKTGGGIWFLRSTRACRRSSLFTGPATIKCRTNSQRCCATRCARPARAATSSLSRPADTGWGHGKTRISSTTRQR